ncbi:hypothetical protein Y032_0557g3402 [Ancylostoma ceylanicum]|uniref:Uncharacterized protein n=1 Tax=Ancylostoma ceylanicum TaxID=53326 RepID=A0A016WPN4_9BILA|nr:hypothetical protein Y032_0557g3402 [Ancylostoma ceylanicum]
MTAKHEIRKKGVHQMELRLFSEKNKYNERHGGVCMCMYINSIFLTSYKSFTCISIHLFMEEYKRLLRGSGMATQISYTSLK